METVINTLTLDNFAFVAGEGSYKVNTSAGEVIIEMTKKTSHVMPGNFTGYDCTINGQSYERKPIGFYKKMFGAVINHREGSAASTAKVMTEAEITEKVAAFQTDLTAAFARLEKVLARCLTADSASDATMQAKATIPSDICEAYRAELLRRNAEAEAEKAAAEKAAAERKEKAERKDIAKAVLNASDIQKAIIEATMAGDFAKVAELTASLASA